MPLSEKLLTEYLMKGNFMTNAIETLSEKDVPAMTPLTPMAMIGQAVQSGANIETLERLMGLQERWEANEAKREYNRAMASCRAEIKPIIKRQEANFGQGKAAYKFEDMAAISDVVDPIMAKYGLFPSYRSKQEGATITITCVINHARGHSNDEASLAAPADTSGSKNPVQAVGSTTTYLQRYTLKLAMGLAAAKDDDAQSAWPKNGGGSLRTITEDEIAELRNLLEAADRSEEQLLGHVVGTDITQLSEAQFLKGKAKCLEVIRAAKESQ